MDTPKNSEQQDLVYKEIGQRELMLTFLPPINIVYEYAPVYFIIPGGGWHFETRESMLDFSAISVEKLRKQGFATVSIDYRVAKEDGVGIEEVISDCFDAARYIAHYSEVLKVDAKRMVVSGHSAGGHLALMLAYAPRDIFVKDSVLSDRFDVAIAAPISPPTILYSDKSEQTLNFDYEDLFRYDSTGDLPKKASPYEYVTENCPTTILCAGTSDRVVFCNSSELLYKKLTECGVKAKLVLSLGGGHCCEAMHEGILPTPSREDVQDIITRFVLDNI